jgi:glycosyltransferase involved in cell wall biosynthesis
VLAVQTSEFSKAGLDSRNLRILFFTQKIDESDSVLGFVCDWIAALGRRVGRLDCVCLESGPTPQFPPSVVIHSLGRERGRGRVRLAWESQSVVGRLLGKGSVDAVFAHMAPSFTVLSYPWARLHSIPLFTWYTHRQVTPMLRLAVAMSRRVLTASPDSIGMQGEKVLATGHGIRTPAEGELEFHETESREVLAVGRLTPIKRWETFIEAAALLKGRGYRFLMVGDSAVPSDVAYRERLRDLVRTNELSSVFSFEGAVAYRDMPRYYRRAFCSVNTCVDSSFDKAVLESLAFGKPALTSNRAFQPLLGDVTPELLFPESDPKSLASRIERLREMSPTARRALGIRLRDRVEREHGLERLMDRVVALVRSAAGAA